MAKTWRDTYSGGFLKSVDVPLEGRTVRIDAVDEEIVSEGEKPKLIATLHDGGRWVLNATVCLALEAILATPDPDRWVGQRVVIYRDPSVRGPSGQVVGGIRVRAAAKAAARPAAAPAKRPPAAGRAAAPAAPVAAFQDEPAPLLADEPWEEDDLDADLQ